MRADVGDVGDIHLVHGHYVQDWLLYATDYNWRLEAEAGGPSRALADIGSHWLDLVQFVTGRRIERVFADLFTLHKTRQKPAGATETFRQGTGETEPVPVTSEDGGNVLLRFEGGGHGAVTVSQASAGRKNHEWFEIDGAERALAWNQERPNELWIGHRDGPNEVLIKDPSLLANEAQAYAHYPGGRPEGYPDGPKNLFRNVYQAVRETRSGSGPPTEPDYPTFADGHHAVRLVEAALESHAAERWIDV